MMVGFKLNDAEIWIESNGSSIFIDKKDAKELINQLRLIVEEIENDEEISGGRQL